MDPTTSQEPDYRFGAFELDLRGRALRKNGRPIRIQEHPYRILVLLLDRPGEVVTREKLRNALWPDGTVVDFDNGLNAAMGKLRQTLRDSAEDPKYIETVPRLGYRFIGILGALPRPEAPAEPTSVPEASTVPAFGWRLVAVLRRYSFWRPRQPSCLAGGGSRPRLVGAPLPSCHSRT